MTTKVQKSRPLRTMHWEDDDWMWLAEISKSLGLTRSDFVRRSALAAAEATANGMAPYFVMGPQATPQNIAPNAFLDPKETQKSNTGGVRGGYGRIAQQEPAPNKRSAVSGFSRSERSGAKG